MKIDKILTPFCTKRTGTILALLIVVVFIFLSLVRTYDFESFQSIRDAVGDDWGTYARYAVDIKQNGLLMPSLPMAYRSPSGFLYSYFIALCLVIFGEKSIPIFIIQHVMLGLSVALIYWTFRNKMRDFTALLFLFALFVFALKDVYKNYAPLLLSENLALFTMSLFFFCFVKGFEKNNLLMQVTAAILLGLSILTRPNIVVFGAVLIPIVAAYYFKKGKVGFRNFLIFMCVLVLSSSFLLIRNYILVKKLYFLPTYMSSLTDIKQFHIIPPSVDLTRVDANVFYTKLHFSRDLVDYIEYAWQQPGIFFWYYFKKILFCLGYLPILTSAYALRLRWVIMWIGYAVYWFLRIRSREKYELWEVALHLYIFCYYGTLIMTTAIHNYGFRMLLPAIPFVLVFPFLALDRLYDLSVPLQTFSNFIKKRF